MVRVLKYFLLILFFCFFLTGKTIADPEKLTVTALGPPVEDGNGFLQNIIVSFKVNSDWTLSVTALDSSVKNSENPEKSTSIHDLRIIDPCCSLEYILETGKSIDIQTGTHHEKENGRVSKQFQIRLLTNETIYPGNYTANLQFNVTTKNHYYSEVYTQVFSQQVVQYINILPTVTNYRVPTEDLLSRGKLIDLSQTTRIMVRSNTKWQLKVLNDNPTGLITQYIKIKSLPENAVNLIPLDFQQLNQNELSIVRGEPTITPEMNTLQPQIIEIYYRFALSENEIIPSNMYPFNIQYQIGEIE